MVSLLLDHSGKRYVGGSVDTCRKDTPTIHVHVTCRLNESNPLPNRLY